MAESKHYNENVRNNTLMFFSDILMVKEEPIPLQHLMYNFGDKGFTKAMRNMVGRNLSGLKTFLSQYPSLFSISDDQISLNSPVKKKLNPFRRDFIEKGVKFLEEELAQNRNTEVSDNFWAETKSILLANTRIITETKEGEEIVFEIMKNNKFVGFDTEGINLGPTGSITLVQLAYMPSEPNSVVPKICLFDVYSNPDLLKSCLKLLLESEKVIKVIHDVRNDSVCLYRKYRITLNNVFDTQVAHSVIEQQNTGRPACNVPDLSLNKIWQLYGGVGIHSNPTKEDMKNTFRKDQIYWSRRPLTEKMIIYAAFDVYALVPEVYKKMSKQTIIHWPLLKQLNYEAVWDQIDPQIKIMKQKRKLETGVNDLELKLSDIENKRSVLSKDETTLLTDSSNLIALASKLIDSYFCTSDDPPPEFDSEVDFPPLSAISTFTTSVKCETNPVWVPFVRPVESSLIALMAAITYSDSVSVGGKTPSNNKNVPPKENRDIRREKHQFNRCNESREMTALNDSDDDFLDKKQYPDENQVFVGNLPQNIDEKILRDFFAKFGKILDVRIHRQNQKLGSNVKTGVGRSNYAFVTFENPDIVQQILKQKPIYFDNHRFNVEEKRSQTGRDGSSFRDSNKGNMGPNRSQMGSSGNQKNRNQFSSGNSGLRRESGPGGGSGLNRNSSMGQNR